MAIKVEFSREKFERLRKIEGYENISDEDAYLILSTLKRLAELCFIYYREVKEKEKEQLEKIAA